MDIMVNLQTIFQDVFDNAHLTINAKTSAADIDEWDSLVHIRLIMAIEKHFNIKFSLDDLQHLKNVGEMANLIQNKQCDN